MLCVSFFASTVWELRLDYNLTGCCIIGQTLQMQWPIDLKKLGQPRPLSFILNLHYFHKSVTNISITYLNYEKEHRLYARDSNPGPKDGRHLQIHRAIPAHQLSSDLVCTIQSSILITQIGKVLTSTKENELHVFHCALIFINDAVHQYFISLWSCQYSQQSKQPNSQNSPTVKKAQLFYREHTFSRIQKRLNLYLKLFFSVCVT